MKIPGRGEHHLLLTWLIFAGVTVFALFVFWHTGALAVMYASDQSKICWAITLLFLLVSLHAGWRILFVSTQLNGAAEIRRAFHDADSGAVQIDNGRVRLGRDGYLPDCLMSQYLRDLIIRIRAEPAERADPAGGAAELIEVFRHRLKNPHELGWFLSDVMIKLGLLGTIVGFVLMLGSVVNVTEFDTHTMQGVLKSMSYGMGTALYTTFAGLVCCIITNTQYYLLDQEADHLIETARELAHTKIFPGLLQAAPAHAQKLSD